VTAAARHQEPITHKEERHESVYLSRRYSRRRPWHHSVFSRRGANRLQAREDHRPGDKGGHGDWTTFDAPTRTVWLSQSPDHNVVVIDANSMTVKGVIPGIEDGNGIAITSADAFLSDNKGDVIVVVDKRTLTKVATLKPIGKGPNGTVYDSKPASSSLPPTATTPTSSAPSRHSRWWRISACSRIPRRMVPMWDSMSARRIGSISWSTMSWT